MVMVMIMIMTRMKTTMNMMRNIGGELCGIRLSAFSLSTPTSRTYKRCEFLQISKPFYGCSKQKPASSTGLLHLPTTNRHQLTGQVCFELRVSTCNLRGDP